MEGGSRLYKDISSKILPGCACLCLANTRWLYFFIVSISACVKNGIVDFNLKMGRGKIRSFWIFRGALVILPLQNGHVATRIAERLLAI